MKNKLLWLFIITFISLPLLPLAQGIDRAPLLVQDPTNRSASGLYGLIVNLVDWFFTIVILASVVAFLYAGFLFITASGDEGKLGQAKKMITYGVIGVAVALMAQVFIYVAASLTSQRGISPLYSTDVNDINNSRSFFEIIFGL